MRHPVLIAAIALAALGAGTALADDDDDCDAPMADWQPRSAVQRMAQSQGWTVRRIKTDDGCYEIKGRTADGREFEAKVHPTTLEILEVETEDEDDDEDRDHAEGIGNPPIGPSNNQGAAPAVNPAPKNRLLNGNSRPSVVVE